MGNKIKSRKFIVFAVWSAIGIYMVATSQTLEIFLPNFMIISALYIGGNAAQHIAYDISHRKE